MSSGDDNMGNGDIGDDDLMDHDFGDDDLGDGDFGDDGWGDDNFVDDDLGDNEIGDHGMHYLMPYPSTPFEQQYRCYSVSSMNKPHLENGNKVLLPASALDRLASLEINYPMMFEVHNPSMLRMTHCGVLEFVAEEGKIYMPNWMMQNMVLQEGDLVRIKSATLPKGTFVKLQPHTKDFLDLSNTRAMLEMTLRNFSCLTVGDSIMIDYNKKKYYIDIIESKPANAISIIETDCEVDFAPPLDYKEPERVTPPPVPIPAPLSSQDAARVEEPKFRPFTGIGRRIDGKPSRHSTGSIPATTTTTSTTAPSATTTSSAQRPIGTPPSGARRPSGKLVFGGGSSNGAGTGAAKVLTATKEEKEPEGSKFQAFTGRKYTLRD